jgi:hypothetical protein
MLTRVKAVNASKQHISHAKLIQFAFELETLSDRQNQHFDSCNDCRSAFRAIMQMVTLPASDALKRTA